MISAPQQILVESGRPTDSVAVTREALPPPDEGVLLNVGGFDEGFRVEALNDSLPTETDGLDGISPNAWLPDPTPPPRADEVASNLSAKQKVEAPSASRQVMLIAAIGLCSVVLASAVLFGFLKWYARPTAIAKNDRAVDAATAQPLTTEPSAIQPVVDAALPTDTSSSPTATDVASSVLPQVELTLPGAGTDVPIASQASGNNSIASSAASDSSAVGTNDRGSAVPRSAPLGSTIAPNLDAAFDAPQDSAMPKASVDTLPPGLQNFANIFEQRLEPVLPDASVPLSKAPEAGDDGQPPVDAPKAASAPTLLSLPEDLEQKQAATFGGLAIQNRPLSEVLTTLSIVSDIPLVIDVDRMVSAGVAGNPLINFRSIKRVSMAQVFETIAADHQLSFEPYEKRLVVVRGAGDALVQRLPHALPIRDLVNEGPESEALVKALHELMPELNNGLTLVDGQLQYAADAPNQMLWLQVARLLQTWRIARGIENAEVSALLPPETLLTGWPMDSIRQMTQTKLTQSLPTEALALSWQRLAKEAKLACWVDWPSLASSQISPRQAARVVTPGRTVQDVLQHYASKHGITFAVEDAKSLWVTTPAMHKLQPRLYVLPLAGKSLELWRTELEDLAPLDPIGGAEALKLIPTSDGQFLFVRCCRPVLVAPQP